MRDSGSSMNRGARGEDLRERTGVSAVLFLCLFASQAGLIALSPVLAQVASDLGVSTATAGQLRTISGLAAGATAIALARAAGRFGLRELLLGGALVLGLGSLASAVAPSFAALALAQVLIGIAAAVLVTAGTSAAAEWAPAEHRARVLSWALNGQPAAWIIGMPAIGAIGEISWRYAWVALPLAASAVAALAVARQPSSPPAPAAAGGLWAALAEGWIRRWALGELLANSAWTGTLVYAGALLAESYGTALTLIGVVLALAAGGYVAGNLTFRRFVGGESRRLLVQLSLALAASVALFGAVRPDLFVSAILLAALAFLAGGRTLVGSALGLEVAPERRRAVMAARAAAVQFGYFVGSAVGGLALAASGHGALGLVLGSLFAAAALPLSALARPRGATTVGLGRRSPRSTEV
jgi:predicted MFS family arabinose efflux permease